jgi:hypothetical protein
MVRCRVFDGNCVVGMHSIDRYRFGNNTLQRVRFTSPLDVFLIITFHINEIGAVSPKDEYSPNIKTKVNILPPSRRGLRRFPSGSTFQSITHF